MEQGIIVNDASLPFPTEESCIHSLPSFFWLLRLAHSKGIQFGRADGVEGKWSGLNYFDGFIFGRWLGSDLNRDERLAIKSVMDKVACPLNPGAKKVQENRIYVLADDSSVYVEALGFASTIQAHGLSFASEACWEVSQISIVEHLDVGGTYRETELRVPNISSIDQLNDFLIIFENRKREDKDYFLKLTNQGNAEYPNLLFSDAVLKDFCSPRNSGLYKEQIVSVLANLNSAIIESQNLAELSEHSGLNISGESTATMNNTKLARKRKFKHPTLGLKSFEAHVKNFPNFKRMHFLADYIDNKVCIGYFGDHLPTISVTT